MMLQSYILQFRKQLVKKIRRDYFDKLKRLLLLLLPLSLLCACTTAPAEQADAPFSFYYRCAEVAYGGEDGVIRVEAAPLEADAGLRTVVLQYLKGPASPELRTPLPADWALESIGLTEGTAELVFSGIPCRSLDRTILNACLARTLLQLPGVQRVSILRSGDGAADVLAAKDILLRDNGMEEQEEELVLYVPDEAQRYLVRETQTVAAMNAADRPAEIVRRLLALPESESAIPEGTALRSVSVENGVCTVDLSSQFLTGMPRSWNTERLAVYAIVNSLTELPQIQTVDLWIAGAPLERLYVLELENGLARDERMIYVPALDGTLDVTLSLTCDTMPLLAQVPMQLTLAEGTSSVQCVLEALLALEGENGLENSIPQGTKILSLKLAGGVCTLDLTAEFLEGCRTAEQERMAVREIVSSQITVTTPCRPYTRHATTGLFPDKITARASASTNGARAVLYTKRTRVPCALFFCWRRTIPMNLTSYVQDRQLTIALRGEIDHHAAREIMQALSAKIDLYLPLRCILDFRDVTFMDSSGIAVVIHTLRRMNTLQGRLLLQNIPPQPYKVLRAAGIEKITEIREECNR